MAIQTILIGGQPVLVDVTPEAPEDRLPAAADAPPAATVGRGRDNVRYEGVSLAQDAVDAAHRIESTVRAVVTPIQQAVKGFGPSEWTVELSFGFKGGAGIPFLVNGEASGAVKVSAKWKAD